MDCRYPPVSIAQFSHTSLSAETVRKLDLVLAEPVTQQIHKRRLVLGNSNLPFY